jgi:hypothetical protein
MGEERVTLEGILKAPFTIEHKNIVEAMCADLFDVLPLAGEVAGLVRMVQALEKKDDFRLALETGDLVLGFPPLLGDVLDLLTPTNLICYLRRSGKL